MKTGEMTILSLHRRLGFSLIELMIVIAILGILVSIAVPQYRNYVIQARMSSAYTFANKLKLEAAEYYTYNGRFQHEVHSQRKLMNHDVVHSIQHWSPDGVTTFLHVYMQPDVFPGATSEHAMIFNGTVVGDIIHWNCEPHVSFRAIPAEYAPAECSD